MYLHAGNNKIIREKNIIGIFDIDKATTSKETKRYLMDAERDKLTESASDELPKSFIVYSDRVSSFAEKGKYRVCFSQLSTAALIGRIEG